MLQSPPLKPKLNLLPLLPEPDSHLRLAERLDPDRAMHLRAGRPSSA